MIWLAGCSNADRYIWTTVGWPRPSPGRCSGFFRYYGLYANAHRGKDRKAGRVPVVPGLIEEAPPPLTSKGWAEMIRRIYEVDPMICPRCGGRMRVVAFLTDYAVVDRIIRHLKITFATERPPPVHVFEQTALMAAEERGRTDRPVPGSLREPL